MTGHRPLARGRGGGWGPALRIARRELLRAKGRTVLVLLMVLLPLTAVIALDTLLRTSERSAAESLPRELGDAEARVDPQYGPVQQDPDLTRSSSGSGGERLVVLTPAEVAAVLDPAARVLAVHEGMQTLPLRTADGRTARVTTLGIDLRDPALRGPYALLRGRAPATADEVAVTRSLERFGFPPGSTLTLPDGARRTVVGTVATPVAYGVGEAVVGLPEAVGLSRTSPSRFFVSGAAVTWDDVLQLNGRGAAVLSRSVVLDPPPDDQVPDLGYDGGQGVVVAVVALIAVIAVLEVVLLAGPAFAVGARRQRRALALMAAGGAEPRHVRRVVLAQGLLVGGIAAVLAVVLGLGGAVLARGPLTRYAGAEWGPLEVSVRDVALLCLLGAGTALLAALAPAVLASRQPVVPALQGRRAPAGRSGRWTVVGLVLFVVGVVSCVRSLGAFGSGFAELWVAASAVPTVLGAAALAPALLHLAGRGAGRLPLPLRFAVRDADRQRSRTAPAVAAVTAVVAGVVALATAASSDAASSASSAGAPQATGRAVVQVQGGDADYPALAAAARRALPGEPVQVVPGIPLVSGDSRVQRLLLVCRPPEPAGPSCRGFEVGYAGFLGSNAVVGEAGLAAALPDLAPFDAAAARAALRAGRALVAGAPAGAEVDLRLVDQRMDPATGQDRSLLVSETTVTAEPLVVRQGSAPVSVVLPEAVAGALGGAAPVSVVVGGEVDGGEEDRLRAAVQRVDTGADPYVDRSPGDPGARLVVLLLGLGAGFLVLAGSLAATSLALTEARPDLATMGQVGARPRTRRLVAASYAFVLALVGAALGCAAGLVPGAAGAVAVTRNTYVTAPDGSPLPFADPAALQRVDVPWLLLLGLLVALPLLTAVVAGLSVRSALPGLGRRVRA